MAEFSKITYNYNSRIILNDDTTDTTKFVLLDVPLITDTLAVNTEEQRPEEQGIIDFGTQEGKGQWAVPVTVYGSTFENLAQMIEDFKEAFDPEMLELDATYGETTKYGGYHPLDWTETVGATARNFRVYAKSLEIPQIAADLLSGTIRKSVVKLKAKDPRKYSQELRSLVGAGTANNQGTTTSPVTITIVASGATSTSLEIKDTTTGKSVFITTALSAGQTLVIDTDTHSAKVDGVETRSVIGSNTTWWFLNPGNNTITINNGTNATVTIEWRDAWPL